MKKSLDKKEALRIVDENRGNGFSDKKTFQQLCDMYYDPDAIGLFMFENLTPEFFANKEYTITLLKRLYIVFQTFVLLVTISRVYGFLIFGFNWYGLFFLFVALLLFWYAKSLYVLYKKMSWFVLLTYIRNGSLLFLLLIMGPGDLMMKFLVAIFLIGILYSIGYVTSSLFNVNFNGSLKKDIKGNYIFLE